jgi:iron-sulfur cluster repair protein YtfE (RIC family)
MEKLVVLPDDATRPTAPKIPDATAQQRRNGQRLAAFHQMHLREMSRVNAVMQQVFAGNGAAEELLTTITSMQMVSNMRQFGNLCGATCQMLTGHHSIEDQWIFPALMGHNDGLNNVVKRLQSEHVVIHDLLENLERAARGLINAPGSANAKQLRAAFATLEGFVKSHFGYEQTELEESLGYYGIEI